MRFKKTCLYSLFLLMVITSVSAQDWANLDRFKTANATLKSLPKVENNIVFMGNSITEIWSTVSPDFFKNAAYINRGISGQTTPQMLIRFRQDVIHLHPKAVVILAGTNDIAGNTGLSSLEMIMDNIASMAEIADANGIKVVLSSVLPAFDYPWKPGLKPNEKIPKLNAMIKAYATKNGHVYLDYFSAMADERNGLPKIYAQDEVHPTKAGYAVMEPLVKAAIAKALKTK